MGELDGGFLPGIHDNWPQWFIEYVEKKIAESPNGRFIIEAESSEMGTRLRNPYYSNAGKEIGRALAREYDQELIRLLEER